MGLSPRTEGTASYELPCDFWKLNLVPLQVSALEQCAASPSQKVNFVKVNLGSEFDSFCNTELLGTTKGWPDHAGYTSILPNISNRSDPSTVGRDLCKVRDDFLNPAMLLKQNIMNQVIFRGEMHFLLTQL